MKDLVFINVIVVLGHYYSLYILVQLPPSSLVPSIKRYKTHLRNFLCFIRSFYSQSNTMESKWMISIVRMERVCSFAITITTNPRFVARTMRLIDSFSLSTSTVCVRRVLLYIMAVIAPAAAVVIVFLFGLLRAWILNMCVYVYMHASDKNGRGRCSRRCCCWKVARTSM